MILTVSTWCAVTVQKITGPAILKKKYILAIMLN